MANFNFNLSLIYSSN